LAYPAGGPAQLYRVQPRPAHLTRDTRTNTWHSFLANYGQPGAATPLAPGHDQALFNPVHAVGNLQPGGGLNIVVAGRRINQGRNQRNQQQQQGGPAVLSNGNNGCFAAAGITFFAALEVMISTLASKQCPNNGM
jgi:hypothetical protein